MRRVVRAAELAQRGQADHHSGRGSRAGPPCRRRRSCAAAAGARAPRAPCRAAPRPRRRARACPSLRTGSAPAAAHRSDRCRCDAAGTQDAMSASTHSTTVLDRIEAHSPGSKPSAEPGPSRSRAPPRPISFQVHSRQMPSSFWRMKTCSPRCATAFQNMAGIVSPGTTTSARGWMWFRVPERPPRAHPATSSSSSSAARRARRLPSCRGRTP